MARTPRPWYFTEKKAYAATVRGQRVILVKGERNPTNEKLARQQLKSVLRGKEHDPVRKNHLVVADVIEQYLQLNQAKYSPRAFAERKRYLQLFADVHGWRKVTDEDCKPLHVEQWIADHPDWKSDWTKAQLVAIVMRPFNWAVKKRLIPGNPFRGVEQDEGDPRRPLTDDEFQTLLRCSSLRTKKPAKDRYASGRKVCPSDRRRRIRPSSAARFRLVLIFLRYTGMRPGEAVGLRWDDVDFGAGLIRLKRHKTSKKVKKPRFVPLHPVVYKMLQFLRRLGEPGEHVFLSQRRRPYHRVSLAQRLRRTRRAAGIPEDAKLYGTRHAFGVRSIINGVGIKTVAELMGHSTTRMTEHYLTSLGGETQHLASAMLAANARRPAS